MLANGYIRLPTNAYICLCANGCECLHTNGQIEFLWQKSGIISGAFGFALFYCFVCQQTLSSVCVQTTFGVCWQTDLSLIGKPKCPRFCLLWQTDRQLEVFLFGKRIPLSLLLSYKGPSFLLRITRPAVSFPSLHRWELHLRVHSHGCGVCGHSFRNFRRMGRSCG